MIENIKKLLSSLTTIELLICLIIWSVVVYGIMCPSLISSNSTVGVWVGVVTAFSGLPVVIAAVQLIKEGMK